MTGGLVLALLACGDAAGPRRVAVVVEDGASAVQVTGRPGEELVLEFSRAPASACAVLTFPASGLRVRVPPDGPVPVSITLPSSGTLDFSCEAGGFRGVVAVGR